MWEARITGGGKRFNRDWIFRGLNASFTTGDACVITGGNGSGKSTLLRCFMGYAPLSEGQLTYQLHQKEIAREKAYQHMALCAPYQELYEELTLEELLRLHASLKPFLPEIELAALPGLLQLDHARGKQVKHFSSGMKQRLRLGIAIMSNVPMLLLDEPTSHLDRSGIDWYARVIDTYLRGRLVLVASNMQEQEYFFCNKTIAVEAYKPRG
jgi:ABC-type multidrug transport system ATPase subunit